MVSSECKRQEPAEHGSRQTLTSQFDPSGLLSKLLCFLFHFFFTFDWTVFFLLTLIGEESFLSLRLLLLLLVVAAAPIREIM